MTTLTPHRPDTRACALIPEVLPVISALFPFNNISMFTTLKMNELDQGINDSGQAAIDADHWHPDVVRRRSSRLCVAHFVCSPKPKPPEIGWPFRLGPLSFVV